MCGKLKFYKNNIYVRVAVIVVFSIIVGSTLSKLELFKRSVTNASQIENDEFVDHSQNKEKLTKEEVKENEMLKKFLKKEAKKMKKENEKKRCTGKFNKERPFVYLTFDDGPSKYTIDIMNKLEEHESSGTFFFIGDNMNKFNKKIARNLDKGCHATGSHSMTHDQIKLYDNEGFVKENQKMLKKLKKEGFKTNLIRAPYGSTYLSDNQVKEVKGGKMRMVDWHIDSMDWDFRNSDKTYDNIISQLDRNKDKGIVILMHEKPETVNTLEKLLPYLQKEGYQIISDRTKKMDEFIFGNR